MLCAMVVTEVSAQSKKITGTVTAKEDGLGLPGLTVLVKGTSIGGATDIDGKYVVDVPQGKDTLVFSYIGYVTQEIFIGSQTQVSVVMDLDVESLDEFVITALGISKEKKALGYAVTEVNVEDMSTTRDVNLVNTISGKVAGVQISRTSGGPGSSSRVVLRGNATLSGNNQPLFIVDGIPINNTTNGSGGEWGGVDYGSPISDINPDDIESMTVLKGANAAALYGSRAANGVIVVTTKKGRARKGIGVSFNSTTSFEFVDIQKKFQNKYGAGTGGEFEYDANGVPFFNTNLLAKSWGPKMEGQTYVDWDGVERTYSPQPNNYKEFFEVGRTLTNSIALDGGNDKTTFRFSYTNLKNKGVVPNTSFTRNNFGLRGSAKLGEKLTADAKVSYIRQEATNRLHQSDGRGAARNYNFMPRNVSTESLKDYKDAFGNEKVWYTPWAWQSNPYWVALENRNEDSRDRIMGKISLNYKVNKWLSLVGNSGTDFYYENRQVRVATGSKESLPGQFTNTYNNFTGNNSDFLAIVEKEINSNFDFSGTVGGSRMYEKFEFSTTKAERLAIAEFYNPIAAENENQYHLAYNIGEKKINSLYASTQLGFKKYLYLDITARNDWSSTLPKENNSYFYPSFSLSYVFSEALEIENKVFSFGKVRTSWAQVGSDADPYLTASTFSQNLPPKSSFNGQPRYLVAQPLKSADLKPERTRSFEVGTDLRFFNNRIGLDLTYYHSNSYDLIIKDVPLSRASGFNQAVLNFGEIQNNGVEILLNLTPIETKNLTWDVTINFTKNNSKVVALHEDVEEYEHVSQWGVGIFSRAGQPYGLIVGNAIARDDNGNKIISKDNGDATTGLYKRGEREVLGDPNPDWISGVTNRITYKNLSLSFLVDVKKGGDLYSASNMYAHGYSGTVEQTLEGREEWYASETARKAAGVSSADWTATGGYLVEGVYEEGTILNGVDVGGQKTSMYVDPEKYWGNFSSSGKEIHEPHVYDATYVKLRELSIGYKFPVKFKKKMKFTTMEVSIVGRNLWLIYSGVPNLDPEASFSNGNGQGMEYGAYPFSRSVGFNLKINL